jgi:hypothetical protein
VTEATKETLYTALRDYGFSVVVALAAGWVLRNDVLIPLVEEHRTFVRSLSETQSEISKAVTEQTKLLYEMKHMRDNP